MEYQYGELGPVYMEGGCPGYKHNNQNGRPKKLFGSITFNSTHSLKLCLKLVYYIDLLRLTVILFSR